MEFIVDVLGSYAQRSELLINREAKYSGPITKSISGCLPSVPLELDFFQYAGEKISKIVFNSGDNHANALLSIGEASPYYYDEKTFFASAGAKEIAEGKRNFDFTMRKWKLVAWSIFENNPNLIKNALILSKKSKSIWIVLNVPDRKVACVSLNPFRVSTGVESYSSNEIIAKLFPVEE